MDELAIRGSMRVGVSIFVGSKRVSYCSKYLRGAMKTSSLQHGAPSALMTVLGAWPDATKKAELGQAKNVTDYAGVRLAADAAIWIHSVLNSLTTGRECFVSPRVPLTSVVDRVASRALPWKKAGAQLLVLLETKRPALKQITRQERDDARVARRRLTRSGWRSPCPTTRARSRCASRSCEK